MEILVIATGCRDRKSVTHTFNNRNNKRQINLKLKTFFYQPITEQNNQADSNLRVSKYLEGESNMSTPWGNMCTCYFLGHHEKACKM